MNPIDIRLAAQAALILQQRQEEIDRARGEDTRVVDVKLKQQSEEVRAATSSTYKWLTGFTETYNPHWKEQKRESPYEPFPKWPFWPAFFEWLEDDEKVKLLEKSRTMMATWGIVAYFTKQAMLVPEREIIFQNMNDEKTIQMIDYAKCLWTRQPQFLRDAFPLWKPIERQAAKELQFANGSIIMGIPTGKGKIRSYHPWGYLNDESAFQAEAGESYNDALAACVKIVFNSTAYPGWFMDMVNDATVEAL